MTFLSHSRISLRRKLMLSYTVLLVLILIGIALARYFDVRSRLSDRLEENLRETVDNTVAMVTVASDLSLRNYLRGITENNLALAEFYYNRFRAGEFEESQAKKLVKQLKAVKDNIQQLEQELLRRLHQLNRSP